MSIRSQQSTADNRASWHSGRIAGAVSPYERLRHALEWVMAEVRARPKTDVPGVVDEITRVARTLNERSRP
ncbi:hypothetical protein [Verrucosispora sp. TAA-831]|uniref:hypothetical protein n=1 Tax=Verrucosispora sp. TAA-831 TaxID=3422227 RepID=UPI003D6F44D3